MRLSDIYPLDGEDGTDQLLGVTQNSLEVWITGEDLAAVDLDHYFSRPTLSQNLCHRSNLPAATFDGTFVSLNDSSSCQRLILDLRILAR